MAEPVRVDLPMSAEAARSLKVGDMVVLDGSLTFTAGLPTHARLLDCVREGRDVPFDLTHAAFFHLGCYRREAADGRSEVLYINPTTSTRFNESMPELIRHFGFRCVGGKGGLDRACAEALREVGGVYLAFLGGGAPLHSEAVQEIEEVGWTDYVLHYQLVKVRVAGLGPLTVGIDAHGNSIYEELSSRAQERRQAIIDTMNAARDARG